jgi:mitochondrial import receptor subunit TOM22
MRMTILTLVCFALLHIFLVPVNSFIHDQSWSWNHSFQVAIHSSPTQSFPPSIDSPAHLLTCSLANRLFSLPDSVISDESDFDAEAETIWDRLYALRDIIPATTRGWISHRVGLSANFTRTALWFGARAFYVVSTSALLIGVPFALAYAEDQNLAAMEQEYRMREMGGELLTAGSGENTAERVGTALSKDSQASL